MAARTGPAVTIADRARVATANLSGVLGESVLKASHSSTASWATASRVLHHIRAGYPPSGPGRRITCDDRWSRGSTLIRGVRRLRSIRTASRRTAAGPPAYPSRGPLLCIEPRLPDYATPGSQAGGFEPPICSLQYTRAVRLAVRCAVNAEHLASCQLDHARMKWSGQRESNPRLLGQTVQR